MKTKLLSMITALLLAIACQPLKDQKVNSGMPPGINPADMDLTVDPKEDFYRFANGNWLDRTEIPGDEGVWGGFGELAQKTDSVVLTVMQSAANNSDFEAGSDERKAVDLFAIGMDTARIESKGPAVMRGWFAKIDASFNARSIMHVVADMRRNGYDPFFGLTVFPDLNNSEMNTLYLTAGGLGLPNRDYYTREDEESVEIREKYVQHMANIMSLAQVPGDSEQMANSVMKIEHQLALATFTPIRARNILAINNPMTFDALQQLAPSIDWTDFTYNLGLAVSPTDSLIVLQPDFIAEVGEVLASAAPEDIKSYLKWRVVDQAANFVNQEIVDANFEFFGKVVLGVEEMEPRWERVLNSVNGVIGEAIGKVYVAQEFPPEAKASAMEMVTNVMKAFEGRIDKLEWMSEETKKEARKKLNNLTVKIGYPDKWRDYSSLRVEKEGEFYSYLGNMENAWRWQFDENMKDASQPVDRSRWGMSPQTVNAYFNPLNNEIVFPAAILQPPFYNYSADAAVNYGGMGAVIGHEISHCFDDQGSRFDANGNVRNWWTSEDSAQFAARTGKLVEQFDAYEALDSLNVQGELTLGENIGDLGGLSAAYDGLQMHLEKDGRPGQIDGFTPEQRFFISWATIWRTKYREEALRNRVLTDPHSPGMFRAVGPLENMQSFFEAFNIEEGDDLWKSEEDRVTIW
ncbi:MAG: M13 family metallopeptidase [Bacteroidota bacterium]